MNSLFDIKNTELYHLILNALKANFVFKNGIEYVVQNNEIILIDQFTGRLIPGRAYSDGLQQSLQAKEQFWNWTRNSNYGNYYLSKLFPFI
nr:hypothetical protein [Spiroplasma endosymbiont of Phyllotreta cruciferae]